MMSACGIDVGVLDAPELGSSTVNETGFAAELGKKCYGLRANFVNCGDLHDDVLIPTRQ
jgi:nucleoside 2-deoxyribosyltransferase